MQTKAVDNRKARKDKATWKRTIAKIIPYLITPQRYARNYRHPQEVGLLG